MRNLITPETNPMLPMAQPSPTGSIDTATLELLARWRIQDATNNPEELRTAEREVANFRKEMNENRASAGEPPLYP